MRKLLLFLTLVLMGAGVSVAQNLKDKIYYNDKWYVVKKASEASYYRLYNASDKSEGPKPYKDYYITGELQNEGTYISIDPLSDKNTIFDGVSTLYYKNGNKKSIWTYNRSVLNGYYAEFDSTGVLLEEGKYKDDEKDGHCYVYYRNGGKSSDLFYVEGLLEGKQLKYSDGRVVGEAYYEDGECKREIYFDSNDSVSTVYTFMDYDDDLIIANKTFYNNRDEDPEIGKVSIDLVYDFDNMILYYQFPFFALYNIERDRDERICYYHGKFQEFDHEGRLVREGENKMHKRVGKWKRYYYDSKFCRIIDYDSEDPDLYYTMDGSLFNGELVLWHPNGKIESVNSAKDGLLDGYYYENDSLGRKIEEGFYKEGKRNGEMKRYQYDEDDMEPFIIRIANFQNDDFCGHWEDKWLHDGKLETFGFRNFLNGVQHGPSQHIEGDSVIVSNYKDGKLDGEFSIYLFNNLVQVLNRDYHCVTRGQYRDGKKTGHWWRQRSHNNINSQEEGDYVEGELEGEWITYAPYQVSKDEEGRQVIFVCNYHNGKREGKAVEFKYKDDGPFKDSVSCIAYFKNGMLDGTLEEYDNEGRISKKGDLSNGNEIGIWYNYYYDQKVYSIKNYDDETVPLRFYTLDGKPYSGNVIVYNEETDDVPAHTSVYTVKKSLIQRIDYVSTKTGKILATAVYKNGLLVE